MKYVDIPALGVPMAHALGLAEADDIIWLTEDARPLVLARLRNGAGVTVVTSPEGAPYWTLVSTEVEIRVLPDDYIWKERNELLAWSYRAAGCTTTEAGQLARRGPDKPPTTAHKLYSRYLSAEGLRGRLPQAEAQVVIDWEYERLTIAEAGAFLSTYPEPLALDYEWDIATKRPFDLGIYDGGVAKHVPIAPHEVDAIRRAVGDRLRAGLPSIWHGGRADLGTQYDADPEELIERPPHDTMIMAYLSGEDDLHLKHLTRERLHRQATDYEEDIEQAPLDQRARYVCADVRNSYDLYHLFARSLVRAEMTGIYEDIERPLMPLIASMEKYGVPVDVKALKQMREEQALIEESVREWFNDTYCFDVTDDSQTRTWLTALLGHDPGTLDQRIISWYPNPEIDLLLFYRRTRTTRRNFLDKSLKLWARGGEQADFRIYPSYNQAGGPDDEGLAPQSGRLSSSGEINFQQQPAGVKSLFVPPPGYLWWGFDYSGIELRAAAAVSGEPTMIHALQNGLDMHALLQDRTEALTGVRPPRVVAKRWNFGKLYGAQLDKLVEILASIRIFIDRETAAGMERATNELFPEYPKWGQKVVRKTARDGYVQTWYGRRRYLPEIYSTDAKERAHAANAAINHVVQGTAADLIKKAMVRLAILGREYGSHLAYSVHDEVGGYVIAENAARWARVAEGIMSSFRIIKSVPMLVEGGWGARWSEVH